jgi:hypothetical protein
MKKVTLMNKLAIQEMMVRGKAIPVTGCEGP